jgi:hypothetical protein
VAVEKILDVKADTSVVYPSITAVKILVTVFSFYSYLAGQGNGCVRLTFSSLANFERVMDHLGHQIRPHTPPALAKGVGKVFQVPFLGEVFYSPCSCQ